MQYSKLPIRAMSALLATLCSLSMAVAAPAALTAERTLPIVSTHADAHITGHVVDAMTKKHIAGATIIIQQYNVSVTTDASGHYSFRNQKPGKLTLTMLADGYLTQVKEVTLKNGETLEVNFEAVLDDTQLEEVVITANRQRTLRRYAPTLVSVIDSKSFQLNNAVNLAGGLSFKPGIRVENDCQNCGFNQVRINGLDGRYSQILIDSRPVFSALAGVYGLEQLPANMIDRVEVVRGGGSALYGSSAIAGVVNVITKEPTTNSFSLSENFSLIGGKKPDNTIAFNGTVLSPDRQMGAMIFGQHRTRTGWDANGDGFSEIGQLESRALGTQLFFRLNPYNKITAEIHSIQEKRRGGDHFERPEHVVAVAESVGHSILSGNIRYDAHSADYKHNFQLYASGQRIVRNSYYGGIDEEHVADDKHATSKEAYGDNYGLTHGNVAMGGAQYTYKTDRLFFMPGNILVGAEYLYDHLNDEMPILKYQKLPDGISRAPGLDQRIHNLSQIAQIEWTNKVFTLLLGGRLDEHSAIRTDKGAIKPVFTPRATVRYNPFTWMNLRASYAQGFRAPQTFDEDLHVGVVSGEAQKVINAKGLKPEYSHSFNLSNDMYFSHGAMQANLLLEGFFTRLQGAFNTRPIEERDGFTLYERYNASDASVYGANIEGKVAYKHFTVQAGFTIAKSLWDKPESTGVERSLIKGENEKEPSDINTLENNGPEKAAGFLTDGDGNFVSTELKSRNLMRTPMTYGYLTLTYNPVSTLNLTATCNYTGSMLAPHVIEYGAESAVLDRDLVAAGKREAGAADASESAPKWGRIEKTPSFFDLGARISYDFDIFTSSSLQLFLGANNLLNSFQKDFDLGGGRDSGYIYGPMQPRTVYMGMTIKF